MIAARRLLTVRRLMPNTVFNIPDILDVPDSVSSRRTTARMP